MMNAKFTKTQNEYELFYDELAEKVEQSFKNDVKQLFLYKASMKYRDYSYLLDDNFFERVFNSSTFMEIATDDIEYVFDYSAEYWSENIIFEIDRLINFEKLKQDIQNKIRLDIETFPVNSMQSLTSSKFKRDNINEYFNLEKIEVESVNVTRNDLIKILLINVRDMKMPPIAVTNIEEREIYLGGNSTGTILESSKTACREIPDFVINM